MTHDSPTGTEFPERLRQIETLVELLERGPDPAIRENARALVRALLDLHAAGLAQMLRLVETQDAIIERFARDRLVGSLLVLHGLHPVLLADRIRRALESVRADLRRCGGDAELLEVAAEEVRLRLRGDPSAGPALRRLIETVLIEAAPDVPAIAFEEAWDPPVGGRIALSLVD